MISRKTNQYDFLGHYEQDRQNNYFVYVPNKTSWIGETLRNYRIPCCMELGHVKRND